MIERLVSPTKYFLNIRMHFHCITCMHHWKSLNEKFKSIMKVLIILNKKYKTLKQNMKKCCCNSKCGHYCENDGPYQYNKHQYAFCIDCINQALVRLQFDENYYYLHLLAETGVYEQVGKNMCQEITELISGET